MGAPHLCRFYEGLFGHCRDHIKTVFECGLGTNNPAIASTMGVNGRPGASLRVWRDYFPNARIFGADIDRDVLFQGDRISTHYVDQTSPDSIEALGRAALEPVFDLMIDDGLHTYEAGVCLFEHAFSRLRAGGLYIIEDGKPGSMPKFRSYFRTWPHKVAVVNLYHKREERADKRLAVVDK